MTFEPQIAVEFPKTLTKQLKPLSGVRVLIVEDEILQALELKDIVAEYGGEVTAIAYGFDQAIEALDDAEPDCAILDLNLNGNLSFGIAEKLRQRGIPILFCTAYADAANLAGGKKPVACLDKPVRKLDLRDALIGILRAEY